jgi:hypothetical protein
MPQEPGDVGPPRPEEPVAPSPLWLRPEAAAEPGAERPAPEPLGERWLSDRRTEPPPADEPEPDDDAPAPRRRPRLVLAALLAGAALAIVLVALALRDGSGERDPAPRAQTGWSAWRPAATADAARGAREIAERVAGRYSASDGGRLVHVEGGRLRIDDLRLTVAVQLPPSAGGRLEIFSDPGVLYRMCGLGPDCRVASGRPSVARHLLLRRAALELALHSFRYLDGVQQVAVLLPPSAAQRDGQAVYIRRAQVAPELRKPLDSTLTERTPTIANVTRSPDALLVQQLTIPTLFTYGFTPRDRRNRAFLLLDPLSAPENQAPGENPTRPRG